MGEPLAKFLKSDLRRSRTEIMYSEKALVTTTDIFFKEGNNDMGKKPNVMKKSITPTTAKRSLTQSTKQRNHKHPIKN